MNKDVKIGHIYVLSFPNGKRYVGQTIRSVRERMRLHWSCARKVVSYPVDKAMGKYGRDNVKIEKIFTFKCTQEYLNIIEDRTIKYFNAAIPVGYNIREGGSRGRFSHTEEAKIKISLARKGKPSWHKGKYRSEETKRKISLSLKGRQMSSEQKAKLSILRMGQQHTEETKKKMSVSKKGERNAQSKLTQQQVREIRSLYVPHHEEYGVCPLAKKYGIDYTNMLKVVTNKSYRED